MGEGNEGKGPPHTHLVLVGDRGREERQEVLWEGMW